MTDTAVEVSKQENLEDLFDLFAVDEKRVTGGSPMTLAGTVFKVARITSPRYTAARSRLLTDITKRFGEHDEADEALTEKREKAFKEGHRKILAKHILVGWDKLKFGGEIYDGYNEEVAIKIMSMDDLADKFLTFAGERTNYLLVSKDEAKN